MMWVLTILLVLPSLFRGCSARVLTVRLRNPDQLALCVGYTVAVAVQQRRSLHQHLRLPMASHISRCICCTLRTCQRHSHRRL